MGSSRFWLNAADEESKSIPHEFPRSHWLKATGQYVLERYLSATMSVGSSILGGTTGWNMEVDLEKRLVFPDVVQTTLRPDIVLWSKTGKKLIVIELTVPWETRCEEAYERKKANYTELLDLCKEKGWHTWLFPVEVGVRGFCSQSVCRLMTAVGTSGRDRKRAI